jgi:GAF domain-containing protein
MQDGHQTIAAQLVKLVAGLDRRRADTKAGLHQLIMCGVHHVEGAQYAGISLAEKGKAVSNVVATHRHPMVLDAIQDRHGEGPCLAGRWHHQVMRIDDLTADRRWPRYQRCALEHTPIRSILSYELFVDGGNLAALSFYADHPHAFGDESVEVGGVFATHVALAWSIMRREDQFRSALASRDIIGQAKGVVMERFKLDAVEAFDLLTRLSQQSNTRVIDIATTLIDSEHPLKRQHAESGW